MHIAVVIPAYNVGPFLAEAIASVLRQTHSDWSLMVVDDGSTDNTSAVVAAFTDSRISFTRQCNAGVSAARNVGITACLTGDRGCADRRTPPNPDAFLFLDGDDWLAPGALSCLADVLEHAPWAVAACGRYTRVAADGSRHVAPRPPDGSLLERLLTRNLFINGGHVLIRREAIEATGPFRDDLSYGEDWEFWTRLALVGEFAAATSPAPVLFVRERIGSAVFAGGIDPHANNPALQAIYANPAIVERLGRGRLAALARRAEAETAWAVGRELIRHGRYRDGQRWLRRSIRAAPSVRRLALAAAAWMRRGRFRPYPAAI